MRGNRLRTKIKGLLALGQLKEALAIGTRYIEQDIIIVLSGEFYRNRRDFLNGFIVNQRYNTVNNRITLAYLELLKEEEVLTPVLNYRRIWKPRRIFYILILPFLDLQKLGLFAQISWAFVTAAITLFTVNKALDFPVVSGSDNLIQVNIGVPVFADGFRSNSNDTEPEEETSEPEVQPEPQAEETPPPAVSDPNPEPPQRDVVTTDDAQAIALRKKQEREAAGRKAQEDAARREAESERERQRQAAAAAAAAAEAERQRKAREVAAQATRDQVGGLFNSGGGRTTSKPGDDGATNSDPSSSDIGTKSFSSGTLGGGLGSRGVTNSPRLVENSQKSGTVVINLCVNASGSVDPESVKFNQRGSTTTDSQLVNAAIRNAKKWEFSPGSVDRQCGTITYNFKVQ